MKFGMRKPSIKKSISARTKGKAKSNPWLWKERDRMDKRS